MPRALPGRAGVEHSQRSPGSRRFGWDQQREQLALKREGKSPGSGRLLRMLPKLCELCTRGLACIFSSLCFFPIICRRASQETVMDLGALLREGEGGFPGREQLCPRSPFPGASWL